MNIKYNAISSAPLCQNLSIDDTTRVLVVGDLDADITRLNNELSQVNFDPQNDVLISLGDVIDRGPNSAQLVDYFQQIGAHMVLGNHEHMMLESLLSRDTFAMRLWTQNGGKWHHHETPQILLSMCKWLKQQPLAIKLQYQGCTIGISHTLPVSWNWNAFPTDRQTTTWQLLWDRERFTQQRHISNSGVDFSVHGHNSTPKCLWIGNTFHIDTNQYGSPTVIDLTHTIAAYQQQVKA